MRFAPSLRAITPILLGAAHIACAQSGTLTVSPSPLILCGQPNQAVSGVPLFITASAGSVTFIATGLTSQGDWLQLEPGFGTVTAGQPYQLLVDINTGGQAGLPLYNSIIPFGNGDYTGQIILSDLNGAKLATVPVLLRVSAAGCGETKSGAIYSSSGPLTFQVPPSATAGITLLLYNSFRSNVTVVTDGSTSTGQKWITSLNNNFNIVTGTMYPTPLGVGVTSNGLSPGTYSGKIEIDSSSYSILNLPLTLNVSPSAGSAQFAVTPSPLSLTVLKDTASTGVNFTLTNLTPAVIGISVSPNSNGRNWLAVSPSATVLQPNETTILAATIAGAGLNDGVNKGSVNVQVTSGSSGNLVIPVTVTYGLTSDLSATPNPLNLSSSPGASNPAEGVISVSTNSGGLSFSAKTFSSTTQPWLSVKPFFSTVLPGTPVDLTVDVNPALVPAGPAIGLITLVRSDGTTALTIPVNVNSGKDTSLSVSPAQISFSYPFGAPFPQAQVLSLTSAIATNYSIQATTSSGGKWLVATPSTVTTEAGGVATKVTVQVNPAGLAPSTYQGQIAIVNTSSGTQQLVPVTLTLGPALPVSASPASLTFTYQAGSLTAPQPQSVQISSTGGSTLFTATALGLNGAPDFLTVNSANGNTPATLSVGVNAASLATLATGEYQGSITISSAGIPGGSQIVNVTLIVSPASPKLTTLVNSASLSPGPVSPGEMVTLFGSGLAGGTVTFDGFAAAPIYTGADQINAIVPYEIAGRSLTNAVVTRNGIASAPLILQVMDTVPAIFAATQNGNGQAAILNADNSYNSVTNPAAKGSVIQIFATGEGVYPGAATGSIAPSQPPFPVLAGQVRVTIGGIPSDLLYASEAPGSLSGLLQVNAVIPDGVGSGPLKIVLMVGDNSNSSQTVTVAVQ